MADRKNVVMAIGLVGAILILQDAWIGYVLGFGAVAYDFFFVEER